MDEPIQFDAPRVNWLDLWQGPFRFRATYDRGIFGPGHSIDEFNKYGLGRSKDLEIYKVFVDPMDGSIVIEWRVGLAGQKPPYQKHRFHDGGPGRGLYDRLKADGSLRQRHFQHLPPNLRERAVGAYATAVSLREWLEKEFVQAIHAGQCDVWARVGSRVAPFTRIPADIFRAYTVKSWGYGQPGAARAELDGAATLYAIYVAPAERLVDRATSPPTENVRAPSVKAGRPPSDNEILAKAEEMKARGLDGRTIAKQMRLEPGFENVATTAVRDLIKGRWKPAGRPKKAA